MQYLLLCYFEERRWTQLPASQRDVIMREYGAWVEGLRASGHLRAEAKLGPTAAATQASRPPRPPESA